MGRVATTTIRLDDDEERLLDRLAADYGGRSNVLREGLRLLATETERHEALAEALASWEIELGPVDEAAVTAIAKRYKL